MMSKQHCIDNQSKIIHKKGVSIITYGNGSKIYYLNEIIHREDGAAIEWSNGDKEYFLNGKRHRKDGPAVECINGDKVWYLDGKQYDIHSNEEWLKFIKTKILY